MRMITARRRTALFMILPLLTVGNAGFAAPAAAADRIFAAGFEPCCTLGGQVDGLVGDGLVLDLAGGTISEDTLIDANAGAPRLYTFSTTAPPGTAYLVTISTQPSGQICTLTNASGTVVNAPIENINATCVAGPASLIWNEGAWDDANWQ